MKKIIPVLLLISFLTTTVIMFLFFQNKKEVKYLTINTEYAYVYNKEFIIEVYYFCNELKNPISNLSFIKSTYLTSQTNTKKLEVAVYSVENLGSENFYNEVFYQFNIKIVVPNLKSDWSIVDTILLINLVNYQQISLNLGHVSIYYEPISNDIYQVSSLYADKNTNYLVSRINKITLEGFLQQSIELVEVFVSKYVNVLFYFEGSNVIIEIEFDLFLYNNAFILLIYSDNSKQIINNFLFFWDTYLLNNNVSIINVNQTY